MHATLSQSMLDPPDITIRSSRGRTILVAECKFERDTSSAAAARLRNRFLVDGYLDVPSESFFLLVFPGIFHLWKPGAASDELPCGSADALPVLRPYLGRIADLAAWPGAESIQLGLTAWLSGFAAGIRKPGAADADQMLVSAGLYELMKGGTVRRGLRE
jgi:hypothetical protein